MSIKDAFGELRSLLEHGVNELARDDARRQKVTSLLERVFEEAPDAYTDEWLPYLSSNPQQWDGLLFTVSSLEELERWSQKIMPFAWFRLDLVNQKLPKKSMTALVNCTHLANVRELDLRGVRLRAAGAKALFASPNLGTITRLRLAGCSLDVASADELVGAASLGPLEFLDLEHNRLKDEGIETLANGLDFSNMRGLILTYNKARTRAV
ncbi:MAG: hypothetical protein VX475_13215, partial [Myxococcota bacterium]|nr:hypothetical protein [Myxococcota bacterium]